MYESLISFPSNLFGDIERLQRNFDEAFGLTSGRAASIRSVAPGTFPPINIGTTPRSVEIYAFAPGVDPGKVELTLDRGVLMMSGERPAAEHSNEERVAYVNERVTGSFRRAINLPDDIDPNQVNAEYVDGLLHISISRREEAQPKRISIQ